MPGGQSQHDFLPLVSLELLAIVTIRLSLIPNHGNPPNCVFENLFTYLPDNLELIDLPFDFSSEDSIQDYKTRVNGYVKEFKSGAMKQCVAVFRNYELCMLMKTLRFHCFAVYIADHTDPECGDLHFTPENQGAAHVAQVSIYHSNIIIS